jgi:hypothetical protein
MSVGCTYNVHVLYFEDTLHFLKTYCKVTMSFVTSGLGIPHAKNKYSRNKAEFHIDAENNIQENVLNREIYFFYSDTNSDSKLTSYTYIHYLKKKGKNC